MKQNKKKIIKKRRQMNLDRFISAQENTYHNAFQELQSGKKITHWMWFMFPQIKGLGKSDMAKKFELTDREEAKLYLEHKILSTRLLELTQILVKEGSGKTAEDIFGFPDVLKFQSCMTLFYSIVEQNKTLFKEEKYSVFKIALDVYYGGNLDLATLKILNKEV